MNIFIDDNKIKDAAKVLCAADQNYDDLADKPSPAVYIAAVEMFLTNAAEGILAEPEYYAYGPNRILSSDDWERAFAHAQHWHNHPLTALYGVPKP